MFEDKNEDKNNTTQKSLEKNKKKIRENGSYTRVYVRDLITHELRFSNLGRYVCWISAIFSVMVVCMSYLLALSAILDSEFVFGILKG